MGKIDFSLPLYYDLPQSDHKSKYALSGAILTKTFDTYLKESVEIMGLDCIANAKLEDTGFNYTMSLIQGKYKMFILYALMEFKVVRFNEMKKYIGSISFKTLSSTLKELEADGLVHREEYPQIPPKVEYSLTERGKSLIPILDQMCTWGEEHRG